MTLAFKRIGIIGRLRHLNLQETLQTLFDTLQTLQVEFYVEEETAKLVMGCQHPTLPKQELANHCDLMIVVGGDGSLLQAAHLVVPLGLPLLGINKGRLGFLTDISPDEIKTTVSEILNGHYKQEMRFLLSAQILNKDQVVFIQDAINEVVVLPGMVAQMIEFETLVNGEFVTRQRADGLIVATPTGSTAYALSGGGPIMHPQLDAIVLVPMFPHTLSSRPLVLDANSIVHINFPTENDSTPSFSCDGFTRRDFKPGESLRIVKKEQHLTLIHPLHYNYYQTLRTKLNWETSLAVPKYH